MRTLRTLLLFSLVLALAAAPGSAKNGAGLPPDHPLLARLAASDVERGREYRALVLYPIAAEVSDPADAKRAMTAVEAEKKENLSIREPEKKAGRETVEIFDFSTEPVLLLAGEILEGGLRDRFLTRDVLLGPASRATAPALPAEDRARPKDEESRVLSPFGAVVPDRLRREGLIGSSPAAAAEKLAEQIRMLGGKLDRRAVTKLFDAEAIEARSGEYRSIYGAIPDEAEKRTIGAAAFVGERLVGIDLFETNLAFRAHWPTLLRTRALEAALYEKHLGLLARPFPAGRDPDRHREGVKALLKKVFAASAKMEDAVGLGEEVLLRRETVVGRALVADGKLVHATILSDEESPEAAPPPGSPTDESSRGLLERKAARGTLTEAERRLLERMRDRERQRNAPRPSPGSGAGGGGRVTPPAPGGDDPQLPGDK